MQNNIESKLKELNKAEIHILARKCMGEDELNQKQTNIIKDILSKPEYEEIVKGLETFRKSGETEETKLGQNILDSSDDKELIKTLDMLLEIKKLDEDEFAILTRKLGIEKKFEKYDDILKELKDALDNFIDEQRRIYVIQSVLNIPEHEKIVNIILRLKALDEDELADIIRKLGMKEISSNEKTDIIRNIIENEECNKIAKKLDSGQRITYRGYIYSVGTLGSIGVILASIYDSYPDVINWIVNIGGGASIIGLALVFINPEGFTLPEKIIHLWKTNREILIGVMLYFMLSVYPFSDKSTLFGLLSGIASIAAVFFTFWAQKMISNNYNEACAGIVLVEIVALIYIIWTPTLAGKIYDNGRPVNGAEVVLSQYLNLESETGQNGKPVKLKNPKFSAKTDQDGNFTIKLPGTPFQVLMKPVLSFFWSSGSSLNDFLQEYQLPKLIPPVSVNFQIAYNGISIPDTRNIQEPNGMKTVKIDIGRRIIGHFYFEGKPVVGTKLELSTNLRFNTITKEGGAFSLEFPKDLEKENIELQITHNGKNYHRYVQLSDINNAKIDINTELTEEWREEGSKKWKITQQEKNGLKIERVGDSVMTGEGEYFPEKGDVNFSLSELMTNNRKSEVIKVTGRINSSGDKIIGKWVKTSRILILIRDH